MGCAGEENHSNTVVIVFTSLWGAASIISWYALRYFRRQSDSRAQQRYERMSRYELGAGVYSASPSNI